MLDSEAGKVFIKLSELANAPVYVFLGSDLVKVIGEVPYFQKVLENRKMHVTPSGNYVNVCKFAEAKSGSFHFLFGPFRSGPDYNDEELSKEFLKLPVFNHKFQALLDFAVSVFEEFSTVEHSLSSSLKRQDLLSKFVHFVNAKDLRGVLKNASEFFVDKFNLSNVFVSAFGHSFRHYSNSKSEETYKAVEEIVHKQLSDSRSSLAVNDISGDFLFGPVEDKDNIPKCFVAYPLLLDKHVFGSVILYSDVLPDTELVPDVLRELVALLVRVSDYERVQTSARVDPLTGLLNRGHFVSAFDSMILDLREKERPVSLLMIDVDNFKNYNDTRGHPEGDRVLTSIADGLKALAPDSALVCRYGGEEFVIAVPELSQQDAVEFSETLRKKVEESSDLTVSIGLITCLNSSASRADLVKEADNAMYKAKRLGKNQVVPFVMADKSLGVIDTLNV